MTQPHNTNLGEQPMTTYGRVQGPEKRYRRLRFPSFPAATWTEKNPLLQRGEIGAESDTLKMKIGDGITYWNDLGYSKSFADWGDISGNIQDQNDLVKFVNNSVQSGINTHNSSSTAHSNQFSQYRKSSAQDAIDANLQSQITTNANNIASNDTDVANLQANKADKTTDFETPITASNKGATMAEIEQVRTATIKFIGYVSTSAPSASSYTLMEGNLWINSATMPTSFPVPSSSIQQWNGTSWVAYSQSYTPAAFDAWSNLNNSEGYYFFGGVWKVFSTDLSTEYFTLNQTSGLWEIAPSIELPGTPTAATPDGTNPQAIVNVDYVNAGITVGNKITNCILQIPQNINLTLENGTLTLKAGSKVYVPNGVGVFNEVTLSDDRQLQVQNFGESQGLLVLGDTDDYFPFARTWSGGTQPTGLSGNTHIWYDTTNNVIKYTNDTGSTWNTYNISLPIAIASMDSSGTITSIDQVFNGFGFIGSTVFSLPGLQVAVPNGINEDGTLNNNVFTTDEVFTTSTIDNVLNVIGLYTTGIGNRIGYYVVDAYSDMINLNKNGFYYVISENKMYSWTGNQGVIYDKFAIVCCANNVSNKITDLKMKYAFRAVDYNEYQNAINDLESGKQDNLTRAQLNAVNSGITAAKVSTYDGYAAQIAGKQNTLTAGANISISSNTISATGLAKTDLSNISSNIDYVVESQEPTAENGYTWYRLHKSGWVEQGGFIQSSSTGSVGQSVSLPIEMSISNYLVQKTISKAGNLSQGFDWVWIGDSSSEQINTSTTVYLSVPSSTYCNGVTWELKGMSA